MLQFTSLQQQLNDYENKIKALERDLEESRNAHAEEKRAREVLENEKKHMKTALDQMGDSLRSLAVRMYPRNDMIWKEIQKQFYQGHKEVILHLLELS